MFWEKMCGIRLSEGISMYFKHISIVKYDLLRRFGVTNA